MKKITCRVEAVILNLDGEILLALHKKHGRAYWVLPGGHVEFGEKLEAALRREISEELGLRHLAVKSLLYIDEFIDPDGSRHVIKAGFLTDPKKHDLRKVTVTAVNESIRDARFFSAYQIESSMDDFYPSKDFIISLMESANA